MLKYECAAGCAEYPFYSGSVSDCTVIDGT